MEPKQGFFEGPPQTMFTFGVACGLAISAIAFVFLGGINAAPGSASASEKTVANANVLQPTQPVANNVAPPASDVPKATEDDWVRGDLGSAKVVMIEYSDFQCPYCSSHHPTMQQLVDEFGGSVAWVYRHFPLTSIHPQATPAAVAAECAGEQQGNDGFWSMADALFANQTTLGQATFERLAGEQGLDAASFKSCLSSGKYNSKITSQQSGGASAGVTGTPGTFINGQLIPGAVPIDQLRSIIQGEI